MTERQQRFCDYYIETGNATESAKKAGYSGKTAYAIGQENLKKPELKTYIQEQLNRMASERIAGATEVREYLTSVMRGESETEEVIGYGGGVERVTKKPNERERLKAAELLGKTHGIFTDKVNVEGIIPVVISGGENLED